MAAWLFVLGLVGFCHATHLTEKAKRELRRTPDSVSVYGVFSTALMLIWSVVLIVEWIN